MRVAALILSALLLATASCAAISTEAPPGIGADGLAEVSQKERELLADELFAEAVVAEARGDQELAMRLFAKAGELGEWGLAFVRAVQIALRIPNQTPNALKWAQKAVYYAPENPRANLVLAKALVSAGRCAQAIPVAQKAVALKRSSIEAHETLGRSALCAKEYAIAVSEFTFLVAKQPLNTSYALNLAEAYQHQGAISRACSVLNKAYSATKNRLVLLRLYQCYIDAGLTDQAASLRPTIEKFYTPQTPKRKMRPLPPSKR